MASDYAISLMFFDVWRAVMLCRLQEAGELEALCAAEKQQPLASVSPSQNGSHRITDSLV